MALEMQEEISLMEIELFTGRHHQIRVQMAHAGMPLLGDSKYGSEEDKEFSRQIGVKMIALCAFRLQFIHPATGKNRNLSEAGGRDFSSLFWKWNLNNHLIIFMENIHTICREKESVGVF